MKEYFNPKTIGILRKELGIVTIEQLTSMDDESLKKIGEDIKLTAGQFRAVINVARRTVNKTRHEKVKQFTDFLNYYETTRS